MSLSILKSDAEQIRPLVTLIQTMDVIVGQVLILSFPDTSLPLTSNGSFKGMLEFSITYKRLPNYSKHVHPETLLQAARVCYISQHR